MLCTFYKKIAAGRVALAQGVIIFGLVFVFLVGHVTSARAETLLQETQKPSLSAEIISLLNTHRATGHLSPLMRSATLTKAAALKLADMQRQGYFSHMSTTGKNPWYWFIQAGYVFSYAGENLALDFTDAKDADAAWMDSPTHRSNMLNKNFTEVGVASDTVVIDGEAQVVTVELFGAPVVKLATSRGR